MHRQVVSLLIGLAALSLGGCAYHTYAPGPGMDAAELGPASEHCHEVAQGTAPDTSFEASGSPKFTAAAAGVGFVAGLLTNVAHDHLAYDDCMQSYGWQIADGGTSAPAPAQPVAMMAASPRQPIQMQTLAPLVSTPVDTARAERAERARSTAEVWVRAEEILDAPDSNPHKRGLYAVLCDAGDRSACFMAAALNRTTN
jgi:hypothetical protein